MLQKRFSWQGYTFFYENSMSPQIMTHRDKTLYSLVTYQKESTSGPSNSAECSRFCPSLSSITCYLSPMQPFTFSQLSSAREEKPTGFIHHHQKQPDCWRYQEKLLSKLGGKQDHLHRSPGNSYFCSFLLYSKGCCSSCMPKTSR